MKFLIQTINNEVVHDFSFVLLDAIRYQKWRGNNEISYELTNGDIKEGFIPIGSVEFVVNYLQKYFNLSPKPVNVPTELFKPEFLKRRCVNNISKKELCLLNEKLFIKSADQIKSFNEILVPNDSNIPEGNYFTSEVIEIESEWRSFVYKGKLVGLQNYSGDFTIFPDVSLIEKMIKEYSSAPVAYTLDTGINQSGTFIIEIHDFFSCGLYGFADFKILPYMFSQWFHNFVNSK